mmetsp:Transcript_17480/g.48053  ORF Transcript_17480/g.48053 Transcript_17480/m.48053 type:complete len:333 (-) Transcript_17480:282-1280(-)
MYMGWRSPSDFSGSLACSRTLLLLLGSPTPATWNLSIHPGLSLQQALRAGAGTHRPGCPEAARDEGGRGGQGHGSERHEGQGGDRDACNHRQLSRRRALRMVGGLPACSALLLAGRVALLLVLLALRVTSNLVFLPSLPAFGLVLRTQRMAFGVVILPGLFARGLIGTAGFLMLRRGPLLCSLFGGALLPRPCRILAVAIHSEEEDGIKRLLVVLRRHGICDLLLTTLVLLLPLLRQTGKLLLGLLATAIGFVLLALLLAVLLLLSQLLAKVSMLVVPLLDKAIVLLCEFLLEVRTRGRSVVVSLAHTQERHRSLKVGHLVVAAGLGAVFAR